RRPHRHGERARCVHRGAGHARPRLRQRRRSRGRIERGRARGREPARFGSNGPDRAHRWSGMMRFAMLAALGTAAAASIIGCAPHSRYVPPVAEAAPAYKENANWKTVEPRDAAVRGEWWEVFADPQLNALEEQVTVSNQTLKAVEAQFAEARAIVRGARGALYPQVGVGASATNARGSANRAISSFHDDFNDFTLP